MLWISQLFLMPNWQGSIGSDGGLAFHWCPAITWSIDDLCVIRLMHEEVIKWKHFQCYWPFVQGIQRSPLKSLHKGQWYWALVFSLICTWINDWVNNREFGDLRHHWAHYDVTVMELMEAIKHIVSHGQWHFEMWIVWSMAWHHTHMAKVFFFNKFMFDFQISQKPLSQSW